MGAIDFEAFVDEIMRRRELPLNGLRTLVELRQSLDRLERGLAADAREAGCTWAEIGEALGIARQSAYARHRPAVSRADGVRPCPSG